MVTIKRVGFDLDNTLYYRTQRMQRKIRVQIHKLAAQRLGLSLEEARARFERNYRQLKSGRRTLVRMGLGAVEAKSLVRRAMETADVSAYIHPNPRLKKKLQSLRRKVPLDLVTGSPRREALKKLRALGIPPALFKQKIYGSPFYTKSDASAYRVWLRKAGCKAGDCAYVGDDEQIDFQTPRKMGMLAVLVERGEAERKNGTHYIVPSVDRAVDLLLRELE